MSQNLLQWNCKCRNERKKITIILETHYILKLLFDDYVICETVFKFSMIFPWKNFIILFVCFSSLPFFWMNGMSLLICSTNFFYEVCRLLVFFFHLFYSLSCHIPIHFLLFLPNVFILHHVISYSEFFPENLLRIRRHCMKLYDFFRSKIAYETKFWINWWCSNIYEVLSKFFPYKISLVLKDYLR